MGRKLLMVLLVFFAEGIGYVVRATHAYEEPSLKHGLFLWLPMILAALLA